MKIKTVVAKRALFGGRLGQPEKDVQRAESVVSSTMLESEPMRLAAAVRMAQVFRKIRAARIFDGPTEVHKWSLAKKIERDCQEARA